MRAGSVGAAGKRRRFPITLKILGMLVILATVTAALVWGSLISHFMDDKIVYVRDAGSSHASSASAGLGLQLDTYREQLRRVAANIDRTASPDDALRAYIGTGSQCVFLGLYNASGQKVVSAHRSTTIEAAKLDVDAYLAERAALAEPPPAGATRMRVRNSSASPQLLTFSVTFPFRSASYETDLVLYAEFVANPILKLLRKSAAGFELYVLDDADQLLAHVDSALMGARRRPPNTDYIESLLNQGRQTGGATGQFDKSDGSTVIVSSVQDDQGDFSVVVERPLIDAWQATRAVTESSIPQAILIVGFAVVLSLLASRALTRRLFALRAAAHNLEAGDFDVALRTGANDEIGDLVESFNLAAEGLRERAQLSEQVKKAESARSKLERYHSPAVVERIINTGDEQDTLHVQELDVTVAFTDLVGFTSMSESMSPEQLAAVLNAFFTEMTECVFEHEGTLDKYIGDCIMYVFGAPVAQPDHALRCVRAATDMHNRLERFNRDAKLGIELQLRTAINSGPVIAGDIGSPRRKDYSVLGDTVNCASRLESAVAKPGQIVIGASTYAEVKDYFELEPLGYFELKGKKTKQAAYRVVRAKADADPHNGGLLSNDRKRQFV